jgi:hypothetical protein
MPVKKHLPVFALSAVISVGIAATAFGGPPFVTDDPQPVDYQHWEFYLASMHWELGGDWSGTAPHFEVNYGAVPDLQLHLIAPLAYDSPPQGPSHYGPGDLELGAKYQGTCYKASGWTLLGQTQGYQRAWPDFYQPHERPKQLWVRELRPGARTILRGRNLPPALQALEQKHPPECPQEPEELRRMRRFFEGLTDWRHGSFDFAVSSLVAVTVCAMLCQVCLGQRDLAAFAADLTDQQMEALGFPRDWSRRGRHYRPPSESSFFRLLSHLDSRELEKSLLEWQDAVLGQRDSHGDQVAVDGKELLNSRGLEIASAYSVKKGRWLGSELVAEGSNEIPAVQALLRRAEIEGSLVTADALNTQTETARIIVQERGGDYLLPVKGNQKGVQENVQQLYQGLSRGFSPWSGGGAGADV